MRSHYHVLYNSEVRMQMVALLRRKPLDIPRYSVFVAHDYIEKADEEYVRYHVMSYNLYLMPSDHLA